MSALLLKFTPNFPYLSRGCLMLKLGVFVKFYLSIMDSDQCGIYLCPLLVLWYIYIYLYNYTHDNYIQNYMHCTDEII